MMNTLCVWRARNDCSNIKPNSCPMNGLRLIGLEWTLAMNKLCALGPGDHFVARKRWAEVDSAYVGNMGWLITYGTLAYQAII